MLLFVDLFVVDVCFCHFQTWTVLSQAVVSVLVQVFPQTAFVRITGLVCSCLVENLASACEGSHLIGGSLKASCLVCLSEPRKVS